MRIECRAEDERTASDMPGEVLAHPESEVAIRDVEGQLRVRPRTPPGGGLDVAEHEHAPGASRHPCGDPSERRGTGVQSLSPKGRCARLGRGDPGGSWPRRLRRTPDERRNR